jgi:glycosyltransferase involved in cell wall biosynthesis
MKIAYVSQYDARDVKAWSGTGHRMAKCLSDAGLDLALVGPLKNQHHPVNIARYLVNTRVLQHNDHPQRDPGFLKHFARQAERGIAASGADLVFAPGGLPLSYLQTDRPIVLWTDCTFANLLDYYAKFSNLSARSVRDGHDAERRALHNCRLILFSSQWAADSAIDHYGVDPARIRIVPFGSNMPDTRTPETIERLIAQRLATLDRVKLYSSGVDWHRKGFDIASEVVARLNAGGIAAELLITGCTLPAEQTLPDHVYLHGFIDKSKAASMAQLEDYFAMAHWFILPSRADCTPIVLSEAASYGLPSLATQTGGIASVVDGRNGQTFPVSATPQVWADAIAKGIRDPVRYAELCRASFREYRHRLNWTTSGRIIKDLLERVVGQPVPTFAPESLASRLYL